MANRKPKFLKLKIGELIKSLIGLGFALSISLVVQPTPHINKTVHQQSHNSQEVRMGIVDKKEPTVTKADVEQQAQAVNPEPAPQAENPAPTPEPVPVLQGKDAWLSASNISSSDYGYVDYIVSHESTWNPDATEPNTGAHGLPQALPYSKTGCGWSDAVCQLNWANSYALARYGSWAAAYNYWVNNHNW